MPSGFMVVSKPLMAQQNPYSCHGGDTSELLGTPNPACPASQVHHMEFVSGDPRQPQWPMNAAGPANATGLYFDRVEIDTPFAIF
jgi:hypothetical protein